MEDPIGATRGARPPASPPVLDQEQLATLLEQLLESGTAARLEVGGSSMAPLLRDGDVVIFEPLPASSEPRFGEVVAWLRRGRRLVVHRVIRTAPQLRTRGDASAAADEPIERSQVMARVVAIERQGRPLRLGLGASGPPLALLSRLGLLRYLLAVWRRL